MAIECEAKLRATDLAALRERLVDLGAADEGECLERNWVLDRPGGDLFRDGVLLRVRGRDGDAGGVLTVKRGAGGGEFKTREEVESMVDSTDDLLRQLEMVGFRVEWIYEKRRRTLLWRDCVIALDECPEMGSFIEIEGEPENIRRVAGLLGLDAGKHIDASYLDLWRKHLADMGETPRHMTFSRLA